MTVHSGDVLRCTAKMTFNGRDVQNTYHILADDTGDIADGAVVAFIEARMEDAYTELLAKLSDNLLFDSIVIKNMTQDTPLSDSGWPVLTNGNGVTGDAPPAVAGLVKFPTATARSQGRKFLGGLITSAIDTAGDPSNDFLVDMASFITELLGNWIVGTGELVFGNYNPVTERFVEWISGLVVSTFKTQRRRYSGSGS